MNTILEQMHLWAWRGVMTFALAVVLVYEFVIPEAIDHGLKPAGQQVGVIEQKCPSGWSYEPLSDGVRGDRCIKGDWVVTLYPYSKDANYGLDTANPVYAEVPCREIPGWPQSRCPDD